MSGPCGGSSSTVPGQLYETPEALIVYLDPFAGQEMLVPVIDRLNAKQHRLPWLDNRRLVMSLTPTGPPLRWDVAWHC